MRQYRKLFLTFLAHPEDFRCGAHVLEPQSSLQYQYTSGRPDIGEPSFVERDRALLDGGTQT
jgi:hypothetical protein